MEESAIYTVCIQKEQRYIARRLSYQVAYSSEYIYVYIYIEQQRRMTFRITENEIKVRASGLYIIYIYKNTMIGGI